MERFQTACELILKGKDQPSGYTEPLLHLNRLKKTIKEYQKFIKNNFDYVGENFAYEARSIHYNNKKKHKGIFGTASKQDLKELKEEGIDAQMVPWFENENN